MRKLYKVLPLVLLVITAQFISSAPLASRRSLRAQLNPNYVRAMAAYKRLEPKLSRSELRALTTIGILNGAAQAEQQMEQQLIATIKDLLLNTDTKDAKKLMPKIDSIEKQLSRDQRAIEILASAMDLATNQKKPKEFKQEMQQTLQQIRKNPTNLLNDVEDVENENMEQRVSQLRRNIMRHVNNMKELVEGKIEKTLDYLIDEADGEGLLGKASNKVVRKRHADDWREEPARIRMIKSILTEDDFHQNLIDAGIEKRQDNSINFDDDLELDDLTKKAIGNSDSTSLSTSTTEKPAKQEQEGSPELKASGENGDGGGGGGLVGIITSLSGGEGGSDVGALIGALTGLVSTLFGPGGLDIESLISTATSLISGLLSGNKNFGTVLGQYVGTAFDGLSGGGGAINNGQFIGNFLGTVVASLSADPEDDDEPAKPLIFAQNLISSFMEAKNRKASGETTSEERKSGDGAAAGGGGSDSGGFIKHIVSHLVSSVVSLVLNASLGASGGASHASSGLFSASSGGGHKPSGGKTW